MNVLLLFSGWYLWVNTNMFLPYISILIDDHFVVRLDNFLQVGVSQMEICLY